MILPICAPLSIRRWASSARFKGKVAWITGAMSPAFYMGPDPLFQGPGDGAFDLHRADTQGRTGNGEPFQHDGKKVYLRPGAF